MSRRIVYPRPPVTPDRRSIPYQREVPAAQASGLVRLHLTGPNEALNPLAARQAVLALAGLRSVLALEIEATAEQVAVGVACPVWQQGEVERALRGISGNWEIAAGAHPERATTLQRLTGTIERAGQPDWLPLLDVKEAATFDPLPALLEAVQPMDDGESFLLRLVIRQADVSRWSQAKRDLTIPIPPATLAESIARLFESGPRVPRFEPRLQKIFEERLAEPGLEVIGTVSLGGPSAYRLASRVRSLTAIFATRFDGGFGNLSLEPWNWRTNLDLGTLAWREGTPSLYLTVGEVASLWHLPGPQAVVPGLARLRRPTLPLPRTVARARGILLGHHRERGRELPVRLPWADLEAGHLVCFGRTGVGKSTLLQQILTQAAASSGRPGLCLIDPHGDLVLEMAARWSASEREGDVVLVDLGDTEYPIGLPLFASGHDASAEASIQATFAVIRLIFREQWSPTRMEDAVFALTATLCQLPGATLLDVPRLFGEASFRRRVVAGLDDPVAREFWADYDELSDAARRELTRPILYRLRAFYRSPAIRNVICRTDGLDFAELMDRGRIVLVRLAGAAIQAEADLLGELIIAKIHLAGLARLDRPRAQRRPFYLAADESQRFRGASLPVLLSEGRKLGIPLLLSTQYLAAWGENLAESILGNVGTLIVFRCGPADSRRLSASLKPYTADQLEDLDRYEAMAKLQVDGITQPAFDLTTRPLAGERDEERLERIRARSRSLYAKPRQAVEAALQPPRGPASPGWTGIDVDEE